MIRKKIKSGAERIIRLSIGLLLVIVGTTLLLQLGAQITILLKVLFAIGFLVGGFFILFSVKD